MNRAIRPGVLAVAIALLAQATQAGEEKIQLRDAPGRDIVAARCVVCHSLDYIQMNGEVLDQAGWQKSVRKMIDTFGAPIGDDDARKIIEYLGANY